MWAGLDGCRGGWVLAVLRAPEPKRAAARPGPCSYTLARYERFTDALAAARAAGAVTVGVDMPIGMSSDGRRSADDEARALLGPRRSTIFPTPARPVAAAGDHREASAISRAVTGKGLSIQAWNLMAKILEIDRWVEPAHAAWLYEVHPELAFLRLAGAVVLEPKKSPAGRARRVALLAGALGLDRRAAGALDAVRLGPGTAADDLLDALAVACSARALAEGTGTILGDGATDERGLPLRICF